MLVDVFNMDGQKVTTVELSPAVFEAPVYVDLMHQAFVRQMANARLGTHDTKTRGGSFGWRSKTVAPEGNRSCPCGFIPVACLGRWW